MHLRRLSLAGLAALIGALFWVAALSAARGDEPPAAATDQQAGEQQVGEQPAVEQQAGAQAAGEPGSARAAEGKEATRFIRLKRGARRQPLSLDTAIVEYTSANAQHEGLKVALIGAVHIGEKAYYQALNEEFDKYEVVLYELVAPEGTRVPAGGGGSRSPLWRQIIADVTGIPVLRSTTTEATCLGAGILAATAIGWYPDVHAAAEAMTSTAERVTPNWDVHAIYDQLYREVYQPLFPAVQPLVDRLTELTQKTFHITHRRSGIESGDYP